jgi:hypothetical protein
MNNSQLYIENIGLGLGSVSNLNKLDLTQNEYVVVGKRENNEFNVIINMNGVGINATRQELLETTAGLLINNDIICKGTVYASNIQFNNFSLGGDVTIQKLETLIKSVNSNLLFFNGYNNSITKNIYTPNYLTIGDFISTYSNSHPFKISDSPNGSVDNMHIGIFNKINNDTEEARFAIGMMGYNQNSPAMITTTENMPLEFHISKSSSYMNGLYENGSGLPDYSNSNYPNLAIDANGCVVMNKDFCDSRYLNPSLFVNGNALISNLYVNDYFTGSNLHLNDIYLRRKGLTLNANQIIGGDFANQEYTFNSNINIGKRNDNYNFTVNGNAIITNSLNTNNFNAYKTNINGVANFNKTAFFNNTTIFNDNITIDKSLNINNDLFINGYRIHTCNLNYASNGLNYDYDCNLNLSGRLGVGILNTDDYNHQFNIIKRNKERFEIYIRDVAGITADSSEVFMGHTTLSDINGAIDNSFVIFTQKNIRWHNIYFYAGKDKDGSRGIKNLTPTLAIMENNRIGINNKLPQKTLDITGEIIANDYFIKTNNNNFKLNLIYLDNKNNSILKVNCFDINLNENTNYQNKKTLNITGGINSYDGYFENNNKLATFKIYNSIATTYNSIGIGIIETNNNYPIPLQVRNTSTTINNNTIIRLYRGIKGGGFNNNSLYTGIDFCDYDMPIRSQNRNNYKWFIYKNNQNAGNLQIGFTDNTYNPTHSCMNFFYNQTTKKYFIDINNPIVNHNYNQNNAVSIKGNVEVEGNINLKGDNSCYMINGAIVGSFSNPAVLSAIANTTNSYYTDNLNDISLLGNKLLFLPKKTTVIAYNDDWIFGKINTFESFNNNSPLFIYNNKDYADDNYPPVITRFYNKSFKNYTSRPDIATIELGIISDNSESGIINNKINLQTKGYGSSLTIFEITPNNTYPYITCISQNSKNQVNIGNGLFYNSNIVINNDTCVNINDDFDCLLKLTNNNKESKLSLVNNDYRWDIRAASNLNFDYNNSTILSLQNNGAMYLKNSSLNISSIVNKPSLEMTNYYYNDYKNPENSLTTDEWINIDFNKIEIETIDYHDDNYDDNFDVNISKFIYKISDCNLPVADYNNYRINNSNLTFNNNQIITFNTIINNCEIDYRFLDKIDVYPSSNTIELIPSLYSRNPNLIATINNFNIITVPYNLIDFNLNLNYRVPFTVDENQLFMEGSVNEISYYSNFSSNNYYNLAITTNLKVKNKPLFDYSIKTVNSTFMITRNDSNYYYNTNNTIFYYPLPNITIKELDVSINYLYNYQNSFIIPKNFYGNYLNVMEINSNNNRTVVLNNSNSFLQPYIDGKTILNQVDAVNFRNFKLLSTDAINKIYELEINDVIISEIIITINKNNYYEVYDFYNNNPNIPIPIINNNYQPHLILNNNLNSTPSLSHKIYSYNNNLDIHYDTSKLLSLDSNGNLNTKGALTTSDIYFTGDIYTKIGNESFSITSNLTHVIGSNFYIHKTNISLNSSNIFLNPSVLNKGGIIVNGTRLNDNNNLFEINNYIDNDNFLVLNSVSQSGFINFCNSTSVFKMGVNNNNFGIWRTTDSSIVGNNFIDNSLNNYNNLINFSFDVNNNLSVDIKGDINTTSNLTINNGLTSYINDDQDYKIRIYGNLKVDGVVITSSDKRIKRDINKIENALDKIEKLTGVFYFNNNDKTNHKQMGLIAQEVKEVIPEVVYEDERGYLNIAYGNLMGVVIEAIKELRDEIKNNKNN